MLNNHTLTAHADEITAILNYLEGRKNQTATAIGSWCGMSVIKTTALCRLMTHYGLLTAKTGIAFYGTTIIYTRIEATSKNFLRIFAKPLDK